MRESRVVEIYLHETSSGPMVSVPEVTAEAGGGLVGDTYFRAPGERDDPEGADREVTLIEAEALEFLEREHGIALAAAESRRNVVTRGVELNPLVGKRFRVGGALLEGMRLCHPCAHLQKMTQPGVLKGLVNRGGLRARVVDGGTIRVGDAVVA